MAKQGQGTWLAPRPYGLEGEPFMNPVQSAVVADLLPFPDANPTVVSEPTPVDVAIIVPAYNEEGGICPTIDRLRAAMEDSGYSYEIVIVDDGSTDRTAEHASLCGVRVVRLPNNQGYGAALKAGIAASASTFVCIIDADGTYPADMIPRLLALSNGRHMVVGARAAERPEHPAGTPAGQVVPRPARELPRRAGDPGPQLGAAGDAPHGAR